MADETMISCLCWGAAVDYISRQALETLPVVRTGIMLNIPVSSCHNILILLLLLLPL